MARGSEGLSWTLGDSRVSLDTMNMEQLSGVRGIRSKQRKKIQTFNLKPLNHFFRVIRIKFSPELGAFLYVTFDHVTFLFFSERTIFESKQPTDLVKGPEVHLFSSGPAPTL